MSAHGSPLKPVPGPPVPDLRSASDLEEQLSDRILAVNDQFADLLPDHGLRRGSTIGISGTGNANHGALTLLLRLLQQPMTTGSWAAIVGLPEFGPHAATDLGIPLNHLALIPDPGKQWLEATGALLDSLDIVVLTAPERIRPTDARRLIARAKQRGSILVLCPPVSATRRYTNSWPESPDIAFRVQDISWHGLGDGHGRLVQCDLDIAVSGRRLVGPPRTTSIQWALGA